MITLKGYSAGRTALLFCVSVAAAAAVAASIPTARGQTWTGGGADSNWSTAGNWLGGVIPISGNITTIGFSGSQRLTNFQDVNGGSPLVLNLLVFHPSSGAFQLTGRPFDFRTSPGGVLPSLTQNSSSPVSIANDLMLTSTLNLTGAGTGGLTLNGSLAGNGGLTKSGTGTVVLNGRVNGYKGATSVTEGTLSLARNSSIQSSPLLVYGGGTFTTEGSINHTGAHSIIVGAAASTATATFNLNAGSIAATTTTVGDLSAGIFNQKDGRYTISSNLIVGGGTGVSGTYNLSSVGEVTASLVAAGNYGNGTINVSDAGRLIGDLDVVAGFHPGSQGVIDMKGGSVSGLTTQIGLRGSGVLNLSGSGQLQAREILVGVNAGSSGIVNMSAGALKGMAQDIVGANLTVGTNDGGIGVFNQTGGSSFLNNMTVGSKAGSTGTVTLTRGDMVLPGSLFIGASGTGTFNIDGGELYGRGLWVGYTATGAGTVNQTGGSARLTSVTVGVEGRSAAYNLSGGSLGTDPITVGAPGIFNQTGGIVTSTAVNLTDGVYNLHGGTLSTGPMKVEGAGIFNQTGGTMTSAMVSLFDGVYNLRGGVLTTMQVTGGGASTLRFDGGTLRAASLLSSPLGNVSTVIGAGGAVIDSNGYDIGIDRPLGHDSALSGTVPDGGLTKIGAGALTLYGVSGYTGGTVVSAGTLIPATDASLGDRRGAVTVRGSGQLVYDGSLSTGRTFYLENGFSSITVNAGATVGYTGGAAVYGGSLRGAGVHSIEDGGSLNGTDVPAGVSVAQSGTADFRLVDFSGNLTQSAGATLNYDSGIITSAAAVMVNGHMNTTAVEVAGRLTINSGGSVRNSGTGLYLGGGSRTTVSAGGSLETEGAAVEVNGGLLINNGTMTGSLHVNYGGTVRGGGTFGEVNVTDGGTFSPGNSPGRPTVSGLTLNGGSIYRFDMMDAAGDAGVGYDSIENTGVLTLTLTGGAGLGGKVTIDLHSITGDDSAGPAVNFDSARAYVFTLVNSLGGVTGFDAAAFTVSTGHFLNSLGGGRFSVDQQDNRLLLNFTPAAVPEPAAAVLLLPIGLTALTGRRRPPLRRGASGKPA